MSYTSIRFYLFLLIMLAFYYAVPVSFRWIALLAGSVAFYFLAYKTGWWILCVSILLTYVAGICIERMEKKNPGSVKGRLFFVLSLTFTVLPWFCVKNGDFIAGSVFHRTLPRWVVPLGISFYTLQMVSYLADIYKKEIQPQKNPAKYALYILFFPHIVQGPIPRYGHLAAQLYQGKVFKEREFAGGFQLILWGFFLKFMIADKSAVVVNEVFGHPQKYTGCYVLVAGVLYSIELYADFLACTQISRGTARLFGIHLSDNFMRPYLAFSIKDFWRRWHISLSSWLRDYIYIPLGGGRKGKISKFVNLVVTFAASGIWHGAGYKFLFWGLLHASYQIAGNLTAGVRDRLYGMLKLHRESAARKILQRAGVFFWAMTAWILFRADSLTVGLGMVKSMFLVHNPWILFNDSLLALGLEWKEWCVLAGAVFILVYTECRQERGEHIGDAVLNKPFYLRWALYITTIIGIMVFGSYGFGFDAQDFIYRGF